MSGPDYFEDAEEYADVRIDIPKLRLRVGRRYFSYPADMTLDEPSPGDEPPVSGVYAFVQAIKEESTNGPMTFGLDGGKYVYGIEVAGSMATQFGVVDEETPEDLGDHPRRMFRLELPIAGQRIWIQGYESPGNQ